MTYPRREQLRELAARTLASRAFYASPGGALLVDLVSFLPLKPTQREPPGRPD